MIELQVLKNITQTFKAKEYFIFKATIIYNFLPHHDHITKNVCQKSLTSKTASYLLGMQKNRQKYFPRGEGRKMSFTLI